jgi:4a-hydroxytetrahydrobiopterin dehydratase
MPPKLTEKELQEALAALPGWALREGCLVRKHLFTSYMDGIRFVEMVAADAESRDHHPDLLVRYQDVTVFLATHSVGGVTRLDVESALSIDKLAATFEHP